MSIGFQKLEKEINVITTQKQLSMTEKSQFIDKIMIEIEFSLKNIDLLDKFLKIQFMKNLEKEKLFNNSLFLTKNSFATINFEETVNKLKFIIKYLKEIKRIVNPIQNNNPKNPQDRSIQKIPKYNTHSLPKFTITLQIPDKLKFKTMLNNQIPEIIYDGN